MLGYCHPHPPILRRRHPLAKETPQKETPQKEAPCQGDHPAKETPQERGSPAKEAPSAKETPSTKETPPQRRRHPPAKEAPCQGGTPLEGDPLPLPRRPPTKEAPPPLQTRSRPTPKGEIEGDQIQAPPTIWSMSSQYASYWNAFLSFFNCNNNKAREI